MDAAEMQRSLDAISEYQGVAYGRVHKLFECEETYGVQATRLKGYLSLSDAFKSFFLETTETVNTELRRITEPLSGTFAIFVPRLVYSWQSLCGAERLALHGYPFQAYAALRNVFDSLQLLSAAFQGFIDFYAAEGIVPNEPYDPVKARHLRKNTEYEAARVMAGTKSGLSDATIKELARWNDMFDYETHGGRLSLTRAKGFIKGEAPLPVLPVYAEEDFALFVNRYCEVAWMEHRLLPLVQPPKCFFNDRWREKWYVIDQSFHLMVSSLTKQLGKPIGQAIVDYVESKFPFNGSSTFPAQASEEQNK